jgi:two-component system, chemotaxis family, protein-glutamate methylesterase/glutaminase
MVRPVEVVVIGTSLGGLEALEHLLSQLPAAMPAIAVVQHRRADEDSRLVHLLRNHSRLPVVEPDDKDVLLAGHVYLAPADYHLLVEPGHFALSTDAVVKHARPSIDVMFQSAAQAYGPRVLGVVLTSASDDGVEGVAEIRRRGGRVIVQDPATAVSPILPSAVLERVGADRVMSLEDMPRWLATACGVR